MVKSIILSEDPSKTDTQPGSMSDFILNDVNDLDLEYTLECGQCFRWKKEGSDYRGFIGDSVVRVSQDKGSLRGSIYPSSADPKTVADYFDVGMPLNKIYATFPSDVIMNRSVKEYRGIRILKQSPEEIICSFILSINKRIPHIIKIIDVLSERLGEKVSVVDNLKHRDFYLFPSISKIASSSLDVLRSCGMGFRAEYLLTTTRMIDSGKFDIDRLRKMDTEEAADSLQQLSGVGPKVAHCIMLYGYNRYDAFPIDVWIKRVIEKVYFKGKSVPPAKIMLFAKEYFGPYCGYAQQYLYHYARHNLNDKTGR